MLRNSGRSMSMAAVGCVLAVGSLSACAQGGGVGTGVSELTVAAQDTSAGVTAAPTTVTADTTEVATDPPAETSQTPGPTAPPGQPLPVTVTTTYAGVLTGGVAVEVGGFVDVVEPDGTCTLTLSRGSVDHTVSAPVTPDGTTASCGDLAVPLSELEAGTWQAVLSYRSAGSVGAAPGVDVVVR